MAQPLMPKATAVWLVDNTALTFDQIADFCELHSLEVQAIADGEVAPGMQGLDPTANSQLSKDEIKRCEANNSARMAMLKPSVPLPKVRQKGARYTPISKRQDRPDAIAWLLRNYPELSDAQISRLIGTTKPTINAVRDKTHRNIQNIKPQSPVYLGLCVAQDMEKMVAIARARSGTTRAPSPPPEISPDISRIAEDDAASTAQRSTEQVMDSFEPAQPTPDDKSNEDTPTAEEVFGPSNGTPEPKEEEAPADPFAKPDD